MFDRFHRFYEGHLPCELRFSWPRSIVSGACWVPAFAQQATIGPITTYRGRFRGSITGSPGARDSWRLLRSTMSRGARTGNSSSVARAVYRPGGCTMLARGRLDPEDGPLVDPGDPTVLPQRHRQRVVRGANLGRSLGDQRYLDDRRDRRPRTFDAEGGRAQGSPLAAATAAGPLLAAGGENDAESGLAADHALIAVGRPAPAERPRSWPAHPPAH